MVTAIDSEPLPTVTVGSTVFKLGTKSLNMNKVLIAVLVLDGGLSTPCSLVSVDHSPPYIAQEPQSHRIYRIETQSSNDLEDLETECEALNQGIFLVDLANAGDDGYIHNELVCSSRNHPRTPSVHTHASEVMDMDLAKTYPCRTRQVGRHLCQIANGMGCKLPIILSRTRTQHVILDWVRTGYTHKRKRRSHT